MEKTLENAIKLLRSARQWAPNHSVYSVTNAMYISPAQSMKNAADKIERDEALVKQIDDFLNQ